VFIDRLRPAPAGLLSIEADTRRRITAAPLTGIDAIEDQAAELTRRIKESVLQPPDARIFTPTPGPSSSGAAGKTTRPTTPLATAAWPDSGRRNGGLTQATQRWP
jgi:hypothetical protein